MTIPEDRRREVFRALVEAQDGGLGVAASRRKVAAEQGLREADLLAIEQEGIREDWPPLG